MSRQLILAYMVSLWFVSTAQAQPAAQVQLPTFNFTTVSTSVSVPDGGSALLGGISRASEGSVERGVPLLSKVPFLDRAFKTRGIGREVGQSNMTVTTRIIIPEEEELRQTGVSADSLALQAFPQRGGAGLLSRRAATGADAELAGKAAFLTNNLANNATSRPAAADPARRGPSDTSLAEVQRRNDSAKTTRQAEASEFWDKGRRAEAEGKPAVAKVFYKMAASRADGELRAQIAQRLTALEGNKPNLKLAER